MALVDKLAFIKATRWKCNFRKRTFRVFDVFRGRRIKSKPRYLRLGRNYAFRLKRGMCKVEVRTA